MALVIGNGAYEHATPLRNPANDVSEMVRTLRSMGFDDVEALLDLDEDALEDAFVRFEAKAAEADTALIFYSGHGLEIGGVNYLIPIDARLGRPGAERSEAVPMSDALTAVSGARRLAVVILDACRSDGPGATKGGARGFAAVKADRPGMVVAFSTSAGAVAWDGEGALSPYTQALTEMLSEAPDADVRLVFTSLGQRTSELAGGEQRPFARFGDMPPGVTMSLADEAGPSVDAEPPLKDEAELAKPEIVVKPEAMQPELELLGQKPPTRTRYFVGPGAKLFREPKHFGGEIGPLSVGDWVFVTERLDDGVWARVETSDGRAGYALMGNLKASP